VPLPLLPPEYRDTCLEEASIDALILSGGNSIASLCEDDSCCLDRDLFEYDILGSAVKAEIPVLGVCRGMQLINLFYGGQVERVESHVATQHRVENAVDSTYPDHLTVNSFHHWGIQEQGLPPELDALYLDDHKCVEALTHKSKKVSGIMWHPERECAEPELQRHILKKMLT
jgi:putative glutamine amidotransferase